MPKAFRRFFKKLPKRVQAIKYSFREFLASKIWNAFYLMYKFLISITFNKTYSEVVKF